MYFTDTFTLFFISKFFGGLKMVRTVTETANNFYDEYSTKYAKVLNKYGCNT